ncbi:Lactaldehyde dehydrogenase [Dirofilaria immitis]
MTMLLTITCRKKDSIEEENTDDDLKPDRTKEMMMSPAQRAAIEKIREGQMTPANQSETIDDAISNWGAVQKIERASRIRRKNFTSGNHCQTTNARVLILKR